MKTRLGFVSNSSSSSFVVITANVDSDVAMDILQVGDEDVANENGFDHNKVFDIDYVINQLIAAKEQGAITISVMTAGGYF